MSVLKDFIVACFSPVGLMTILFASGLLLHAFRRESRMGRHLMVSGAGLYLMFLLTPLAEVLYANLEHPYPTHRPARSWSCRDTGRICPSCR
jgi:hypothetical protein